MAIDQVRSYFKQWNMDTKITEFSVSSATVDLASQTLHCEPSRIAKTLSFMVNAAPILIVTSGDMKIDNSKFKSQFHTKAAMLSADETLSFIGHAIGGVCPFAIQKNVNVYLDISLKRFTTVFPACGSSNSAIELTIAELEIYSNTLAWIDVCKERSIQ